jgi:hypothetical protein
MVYPGNTDLKRGRAPWDPRIDEVYDMRTRKQHFSGRMGGPGDPP